MVYCLALERNGAQNHESALRQNRSSGHHFMCVRAVCAERTIVWQQVLLCTLLCRTGNES